MLLFQELEDSLISPPAFLLQVTPRNNNNIGVHLMRSCNVLHAIVTSRFNTIGRNPIPLFSRAWTFRNTAVLKQLCIIPIHQSPGPSSWPVLISNPAPQIFHNPIKGYPTLAYTRGWIIPSLAESGWSWRDRARERVGEKFVANVSSLNLTLTNSSIYNSLAIYYDIP